MKRDLGSTVKRHVPVDDNDIDRMMDWIEERPDPIDELPDAELLARLVRSMSHDAVGRYQAGALL